MSFELTGPLFDPEFIEWKKKHSPDNENEESEANCPHRTSTHRSLLENAALEDITNTFEKDLVIRYQDTLHQLQQTDPTIDKEYMYSSTEEIIEELSFLEDDQEQKSLLTNQRDALLQKLLELEKNPILQKVIERERAKLQADLSVLAKRAAEERKKLREEYEEYLAQKQREAEASYQEMLQRAKLYREKVQAQQQQSQEIIKESKTPPPEPEPIVTPPKEEKTVKHVWASIPFSLLGLFEFYIIYGLTVLSIALIFWGLSYIPILNTVVDWLFRIRKDTPDMFAMLFGAGLAYFGTTSTAKHIIKGTQKPALMLTGIYLVVLNIIFLIVNLIDSNTILPNIIIGILGIVLFCKYKNE